MELQHRFTVPAGLAETWAHFNDIEGVAGCFPGATVTEADTESFTGTVKVKLGPIALVYNGSGTFVEKDEAQHRMVIDAKGKDKRGNGTAGAMVTATMSEASPGSTDVEVVTDLSITGKAAQFGRAGVIKDVSDKLLGQFVACLEERLRASGASDASVAASPGDESPPAPPPEDRGTAAAAAPPDLATPVPPDPAAPAPPDPAAPAPPDLAAPGPPDPGAPAPGDPGPAAGVPAADVAPDPRAPVPPAAPAGSTGGATAGGRQADRSAAGEDDNAIDLGATVLPVLARAYWKPALAALVVLLVIIWLAL